MKKKEERYEVKDEAQVPQLKKAGIGQALLCKHCDRVCEELPTDCAEQGCNFVLVERGSIFWNEKNRLEAKEIVE